MEVVSLEPRPTLSVRRVVPRAELWASIWQALPRARAYAIAQGATLVAPPFALYHRWNPPDEIDLEAGVVLAQPLAGEGDLQPGQLPGGRALKTVHRGHYDQIGKAYAELEQAGQAGSYVAGGPPWESYLTDPRVNPDPVVWVTEVYLPID